MNSRPIVVGTLLLAGGVLTGTSLAAQPTLPHGPEQLMSPQYKRRQPVAPIFEGWYQHPDGSYTLSFGYFNMNSEESLEIPLGPDNFIEPAEYNGFQPTSFPTSPTDYSLSVGRGFGVFGVHLPADFPIDGRVVWTIRSKGETYTVPGKIGLAPYRLSDLDFPVGNGSMPPRVRFAANEPEGIGPEGVVSARTISGKVGQPVAISVWAADNYSPEMRDAVDLELRWSKYQGPAEGVVRFGYVDEPGMATEGGFQRAVRRHLTVPGAGGEASSTATFSAPGQYILRVEAGNFSAPDSSNSNQCCWTNGYVRVDVTP